MTFLAGAYELRKLIDAGASRATVEVSMDREGGVEFRVSVDHGDQRSAQRWRLSYAELTQALFDIVDRTLRPMFRGLRERIEPLEPPAAADVSK